MGSTLEFAFPALLFLLGALFGSFSNVVIWRLPRGESIVSPGSHCPVCDHPVRWFDNVPVLSWMLLRGRCRDCATPISWRYPAVELLSAVLWVLAALHFGPTMSCLACVVLFQMLVVLTWIDIDVRRLPNGVVAPLGAVAALGAIAAQALRTQIVPLVGATPSGLFSQPVVVSAIGMAMGVAIGAGLAVGYRALRGRTGLGTGDIKLLAVMGGFTGPYVLLVLLVASIGGALMGTAVAAARGGGIRDLVIPFGPFLAAGCVFTVLAGPSTWSAYLSLLGAS